MTLVPGLEKSPPGQTVFSPASASAVVPARIPSSWLSVTFSLPVRAPYLSNSAFSTVIGTISSANAPLARPAAARCWLIAA